MQAVVLCQVEKAKEDMLNKLYSSVRSVFGSVPICIYICVWFETRNDRIALLYLFGGKAPRVQLGSRSCFKKMGM